MTVKQNCSSKESLLDTAAQADFEDAGERRTRTRDRIDFALPPGPLGTAAYHLFAARMLARTFDYRAERLASIPGAPADGG